MEHLFKRLYADYRGCSCAFGARIVSGFLVHVLTQSREREKRILDCKEEEYKELLTALSQAHISTGTAAPVFTGFDDGPRNSASITLAQNDSIRISTDRIFIKDDLPLGELQKAWRDAMSEYTYNAEWSITAPITPSQN